MINKEVLKELTKFAYQIRIETLKELSNLGFGHIGGCMSIVETLALLYGHIMKIDPKNPKWEDRDWFVCSKGHAGPAIYAALALKGYFPLEELKTLNKPGTNFPSHCDRNKTIGVDATTGSLGQGVSQAVGIALSHKISKKDNYTYLVIGDGEMQEGQVWEGIMLAAQQKLDNLITFVDNNKQQLDGFTVDINELGDIPARFKSFGWNAYSVDGHNIEDIYLAVLKAKESTNKLPTAIVLDTVKGKGVTFAEGIADNHHIVLKPELVEIELKRLLAELERVV
jgi:transketolase